MVVITIAAGIGAAEAAGNGAGPEHGPRVAGGVPYRLGRPGVAGFRFIVHHEDGALGRPGDQVLGTGVADLETPAHVRARPSPCPDHVPRAVRALDWKSTRLKSSH